MRQDREIIKGFKTGGASSIQILKAGKGYRRASMVIAGKERTVFKIPSSSHLDPAALKRKARDVARRFVKQQTEGLAW